MADTHHEHETPAPVVQRAAALEAALDAQGFKPGEHIDDFSRVVEDQWVPQNGARVVAKAWTDAEYKARLLEDGTGSIAELGFKGPQGEHIVVKENTPDTHNVIVCTLCSCYPWPVLGLPPEPRLDKGIPFSEIRAKEREVAAS